MSDMPELVVTMDVVGLDWDKLEKEFDRVVEEGMDKLKDAIEETWQKKAGELLHTSKDKYLQGLSIERVGKDTIQATLSGFLPVGLEEGHESYDMKPGLLGNALSKVIPIGKGAGLSPSFRRITQNTRGWMHPGWPQAKKIHVEVQKEIDSTLKMQIFGDLISRISV